MCSLKNQMKKSRQKIREEKEPYGEVNQQTHYKLPNKVYVLHEAELDLKNEVHRLKPAVK